MVRDPRALRAPHPARLRGSPPPLREQLVANRRAGKTTQGEAAPDKAGTNIQNGRGRSFRMILSITAKCL